MTYWTDDAIESLKRLHADKLPASEVAALLSRAYGPVSRNAVIGKLNRLGLGGRTPRGKGKRTGRKPVSVSLAPVTAQTPPHPGNIRHKAVARARERERSAVFLPRTRPAIRPSCDPVAHGDLQPGQCAWCVDPFDAPAGPQMLCCGAPVTDRLAREGRRERTHCQIHFERGAGTPGRKREREAETGVPASEGEARNLRAGQR